MLVYYLLLLHLMFASSQLGLYSFGNGDSGKLGLGFPESVYSPALIRTFPPEVRQIIKVSLGMTHALALTADGFVYSWGGNNYGQLGNGDSGTNMYEPGIIPTISGIIDVDAGKNGDNSHSSHFLRNDSAIFACGYETWINADKPELLQFGINGTVQLSVGGRRALFLTNTSRVYAVGDNQYGQLGLGDYVDRHNWPGLMTALTSGIVSIVSGPLHSFLLMNNGQVYGFGANLWGQLGFTQGIDAWNVPTLLNITSIVQITAGSRHSVFISGSGDVYGMGYNAEGELGLGDLVTRWNATLISRLSGRSIVQVSGGGATTCFRSSTGMVYVTGRNYDGQLGLGSYGAPRTIPTLRTSGDYFLAQSVTFGDGFGMYQGRYNTTCFGLAWDDPNVCSRVGICRASNVCACWDGYMGDTCQIAVCMGIPGDDPRVCSGYGNCTSPDTCKCVEDSLGKSCEIYKCFGSIPPSACSSRGNCTSPNQCKCDTGYDGSACSNAICFGISGGDPKVCNGAGKCTSPDVCTCNTFVSGVQCTTNLMPLFATTMAIFAFNVIVCAVVFSVTSLVIIGITIYCRKRNKTLIVELEKLRERIFSPSGGNELKGLVNRQIQEN
jgi:alpha-tubulin suppressor-like RCC1 family protein